MDSNATGTAQPVNLDAAIDTVAREMTEAEPSGALRARVLEQIQQGRRRPGFVLPRWAWAGAAAAVMLAVASSVWLATRPAYQPQERARVAESRPAPEKASPAPQTTAVPGTTVPAALATAVASRPAVPRAAEAPVGTRAEDSHHLPALAEIEPLRLASVEPEPLEMDDVELSPFPAMKPIEIPSLDMGPADQTTADLKKEK